MPEEFSAGIEIMTLVVSSVIDDDLLKHKGGRTLSENTFWIEEQTIDVEELRHLYPDIVAQIEPLLRAYQEAAALYRYSFDRRNELCDLLPFSAWMMHDLNSDMAALWRNEFAVLIEQVFQRHGVRNSIVQHGGSFEVGVESHAAIHAHVARYYAEES